MNKIDIAFIILGIFIVYFLVLLIKCNKTYNYRGDKIIPNLKFNQTILKSEDIKQGTATSTITIGNKSTN